MRNIIAIFILCVFILGCNKTGLKGTLVYAPTNGPLEDIEISIIPKLQTEERDDLIKKVETDENGEFKVSGLDNKYSYYVMITDPEYTGVKDPVLINSLVEDQTKLINPIFIIDKIPGDKSYVKRENGSFDELTQLDVSTLKNFTLSNSMQIVDMQEIKNYNPTKVKNGEILFCGQGGTSQYKTYMYPITKCTYDNELTEFFKTNNLADLDYIGEYHFKKNYYLLYEIKENFNHGVRELYYYVSLPKGYYIYSNHRRNDLNNIVAYVFEVIDDPSEEFVNE